MTILPDPNEYIVDPVEDYAIVEVKFSKELYCEHNIEIHKIPIKYHKYDDCTRVWMLQVGEHIQNLPHFETELMIGLEAWIRENVLDERVDIHLYS